MSRMSRSSNLARWRTSPSVQPPRSPSPAAADSVEVERVMQRLTAAAAATAAALAALYVLRRQRLRQRPAATTKPREPLAWPKVPLKLSENANELFSVCRLRYQVYVGELKRQNYSYVDDIEQVIEDPCDAEEGQR